jgi:hypothetical protein
MQEHLRDYYLTAFNFKKLFVIESTLGVEAISLQTLDERFKKIFFFGRA